MAKKMKKGQFDLDDLRSQLEQMKKMGGMASLMKMLPGMGGLPKNIPDGKLNDKMFDRQIAIIQSMTKKERAKPDLLNASRRKRIAAGAGVEVTEINKLIKMHRQMADMMKKVSRGGAGGLAGMFGGVGKKALGGMPDMDPAQLEQMAKQMGADPSKLPDDFSKLVKQGGPGGMPGLPGLGGGKFPGLPGLSGLPGKKK
jgi:signal recognition particle subunit SRP54